MRNGCLGILGDPLVCASWALGEFPLKAEEIFKIIVTPLGRRLRPGDFEAAGNGVFTFS